MKGKVSKNKFLKVVLPALLVVAIICQAVGFQAVLAKGNVATTSLMTYPNVQQYTKEAGQDFTLAENSRIFVVANEKTLNNTILLKDLKLKLVVKSEEYDENIEKGKIISQDPTYKENYKIKEHSEISVIISKGTEKVDVPNVVGKTKEEAEKELKDAGLVPEIIEENDEKVEAGIVLSQDPEDGENVNKGSKVKLVVSKGSAIVKVEVPSLVGKNEQEAKALLAEAGLKANIINDCFLF